MASEDGPGYHSSLGPRTRSLTRQVSQKCPVIVRYILLAVLPIVFVVGLLFLSTTDRFGSTMTYELAALVSRVGGCSVSIYAATLSAVQLKFQRVTSALLASRNSSRVELGTALDGAYKSFSQAVAESNSLHKVPGIISQKRAEAMRLRVSEDSLVWEPLRIFLHQSLHIDESLLRLRLLTSDTGKLALRQHGYTVEVVTSIQLVHYWGPFESVSISLLGIGTQERLLYQRLVDHVQVLLAAVVELDSVARKVYLEFVDLSSTAKDISNATVEDRQRLLLEKQKVAGPKDWVLRAAIHLFAFPEPEDMARISNDVKQAQDIYTWSQEVVEVIERMMEHIRYAKVDISRLMELLKKFSTIKWTPEDKDWELREFLTLMVDGIFMLGNNTAASSRLRYSAYL
ncbi:MAG: hypothetical protein L6R35_004526 [Caloplaca aegaea]|nr:MAG: hypothetical protein L6R35_004526 [Caloplaca aegaea]